MNKTVRYIFICSGIAFWLIILTAGIAFAQNIGAIKSDSTLVDSNQIQNQEEPYSDVSLTYEDPYTNVANNALVDFPEDILEASQYTLGVEDVIEISVLRHLEVSGEYIINAEGKIQYEFLGDIKIEGMKKNEVRNVLTQRLSEYIISPEVMIKITGYNSKIVYVIGEVGSPGKIYMRGDTITVREALVQAGLPLLTGKVKESKLITPSASGKVERKVIDINKLLYEGDLRENLVMKPGDTLYIPPTFMAKAMRAITPITQPINAAGSTGRKAYTGGF